MTQTLDPHREARYSTRELQAAAAALVGGQFATTPGLTPPVGEGQLHQLPLEHVQPFLPQHGAASPREALPTRGSGGVLPSTHIAGARLGGALARVWSGSSGAGASTFALALADAADGKGVRTRVLDAAAPTWSGLLAATVTELGTEAGWRRGRRGEHILIDRVNEDVRVPSDVPDPRVGDGTDLTVLDLGWTLRELRGADTWLTELTADAEVLIIRPHELALRQSETALAHLADTSAARSIVVVVGARRWNDLPPGLTGPRLRAAHEHDAVLYAPHLAAKTLPGLGPGPLPKPLNRVAAHLVGRITTIAGPPTSHQH